MSLVLRLLSAAAEQRSTTILTRNLRPAYLLEEEVPVYEFAIRHIRQHGSIPTPETLQAAGFTPVAHREPASYYVERIRHRYVFNAINNRHPDLVEAMRTRNVEDALRIIREMTLDASRAATTETYSTLVAEMAGLLEEYDARHLQGGIAGITTGWDTLDEMTQGMMGGDVIVIAGRPSMGKSWLLNEVGHAAWKNGNSIAAVSMEMGKRQFVRRWVGRDLGTNPNFIRSGQLSHWAENSLRGYGEVALRHQGVYVVGGDMEKHVEGLDPFIEEVSPDLILVDAAYLMTVEGRRKGGIAKWEMIGEVIGALKKMSIRFDRPVLITVQFNRNVKTSGTKEMDLGDIAGSDSIPQDASIVIGARKGQPPYENLRRELHVLKNREGETGSFEVNFSFTPPNMEEVEPDDSTTEPALAEWMV